MLVHAYKTVTQCSERCAIGLVHTAEKVVFSPAKIVKIIEWFGLE